MIAIIDYGVGNLASVQNAFRKVGYQSLVTSEAERILQADKIVLPGVGAFADGMNSLRQSGLIEAVIEAVRREKPLLGICLGMQMLFSISEEGGMHQGLGLIPGRVKRLNLPTGYKVPHVGWNQIEPVSGSKIFKNMPKQSYFYFVHSYYVEPENILVSAAQVNYAIEFTCAVEIDNLCGVQFHPEKSGGAGLTVLRNFGELR